MARNERNAAESSRHRDAGRRSATGTGTGAGQRSPLSTDQTIARARRQERLDELRQLRDSTDPDTRPSRADRPDFGRRPNVIETVGIGTGRRTGLLAGVIAVVAVAAVIAGYLIIRPVVSGSPVAGAPSAPASAAGPVAMVGTQTMLTPAEAKTIIDQPWKVGNDQQWDAKDAATPACLSDLGRDAPRPIAGMIRTLSAGGDNGPTALHLAQAYRSPELATQAYALYAKALGECNLKGSYLSAARTITGLGDQATAVELSDLIKNTHHAVVLNRTGRMINVLDVGQRVDDHTSGDTPDLDKTAKALGQVTDLQCTIAVGLCATVVKITDGPPPIAGDQPGFLTTADIPLPINGKGVWSGLQPGSPADITTSGCENVDFTTLVAENRTARSYVLDNNPKSMPKKFGIDQVVLTLDSAKDATKIVGTVVANLKTCPDRLPTAQVNDLAKVSGTGADATPVKGSVASVNQKVSDTETSHYRVGIVAAGNKIVYTFMYRQGDWDLTKSQWQTLTVRAGQRATQVQ